MNPNPAPGGTAAAVANTVFPGATATNLAGQPAPVGTIVPSGAGTAKPTMSLLAEMRDKLGAYFAKVTGEVRQFTGQTITDIAAEIDKLRADLESKL